MSGNTLLKLKELFDKYKLNSEEILKAGAKEIIKPFVEPFLNKILEKIERRDKVEITYPDKQKPGYRDQFVKLEVDDIPVLRIGLCSKNKETIRKIIWGVMPARRDVKIPADIKNKNDFNEVKPTDVYKTRGTLGSLWFVKDIDINELVKRNEEEVIKEISDDLNYIIQSILKATKSEGTPQ